MYCVDMRMVSMEVKNEKIDDVCLLYWNWWSTSERMFMSDKHRNCWPFSWIWLAWKRIIMHWVLLNKSIIFLWNRKFVCMCKNETQKHNFFYNNIVVGAKVWSETLKIYLIINVCILWSFLFSYSPPLYSPKSSPK